MDLDLNEKQIKILTFIKDELNKKGYPPSVREICQAVELRSTSTVHAHLNKLEQKGYIRRDPTKPRAIEVYDFNKPTEVAGVNQEILNLPLVGEVTAGQPILAKQNIQEYIPLPVNLVHGKNNFVLKVKGDSMINAGILDGDYVIVDKANMASNGQMVVALVHGESATVKTFYRDGATTIRLQPENDFLDPIILHASEIDIIGIVTGVFRVIK